MNRFEKTHEELKRQLASLGIYDADCPAEIISSANEEAKVAEHAAKIMHEQEQEAQIDAGLAS